MLAALDVPYLDARAAGLSFALDLPAQPALDVLNVSAGAFELELRILGSSHQVIARADGGDVSETVACLDAAGEPVPPEVAADRRDLRYAFASRVERLAPAALADRARALVEDLRDQSRALVGLFPGAPDALTAVVCDDAPGGAVGWRTFHLYPQAGEIVTTSTLVAPR